LLAIGAVLADVSFGLAAGGLVLTAGWAVVAIACGVLARRAARDSLDETAFGVGLGAHIALVSIRAVLALPPAALGGGYAGALAPISVASLAATCLVCARAVGSRRPRWELALDCLGLASIAYLTASVLAGDALVVAWALEGAALAQIARVTRDRVALSAGLTFLGGALAHTLVVEAPPQALVAGAANLKAASIALGAVAASAIQIGRSRIEGVALGARIVAALGALYLASIAIVTAFQPTPGAALVTVFDLGIRQQGQVLLSILWSAVGLATLLVGLRGRLDAARIGGLGLLLVTVAKVFLFDLSTLTSIYRVTSFVVLGVLLLTGAFAYHRLRPAPPRT
jgi:hypothetical protein